MDRDSDVTHVLGVGSVKTAVLFLPFVDQSYHIKYTCAGEIAVCNAVFHSTSSCFLSEIYKLRSCLKF